MITISDVGIEKKVIVENNQVSIIDKKEESESKAKSTKKSKDKAQSKNKEESIYYRKQLKKENEIFKKNIYIVFVECETPGNIGFLARTMANFGLSKLILINPCNLKEESYYQATHGKHIVENAEIYDSIENFLNSKNIDFIVGTTGIPGGSYNLSRIPIRPEELSEKININSTTAILFGREGNGLKNEEINLCDIIVSIPTDPNYTVLNISHAAAIIFYELFKNRHYFDVEGLEEITYIEKEYLLKDMEYLISKLDIPIHKKKNGLKTFKNIINRAFITGREAHTLKGILRRLKNKLE